MSSERKSDGVTVRSTRANSDRKVDEFSEGANRIARGGVSRKIVAKRTPCVSVKDSTVCKETASSLAKKEAKGGLETAKVTQTARIRKHTNLTVQKTEVRTESSQRVQRAKVLDRKELSAGKPKLEHPVSYAKREQTTPPCSTSKQPTLKIYPDGPNKPKESVEVSGKELRPKYQTYPEKQIQGKQLEYEASTSKSSLDSDTDSDYEDTDSDYENHRIELDGSDEYDKIEACCCLCERNLGVPPTDNGAKSEYSFNAKPVVAILPCGHAFHVVCLYLDEFGLRPGREPPCVICESTMSD